MAVDFEEYFTDVRLRRKDLFSLDLEFSSDFGHMIQICLFMYPGLESAFIVNRLPILMF